MFGAKNHNVPMCFSRTKMAMYNQNALFIHCYEVDKCERKCEAFFSHFAHVPVLDTERIKYMARALNGISPLKLSQKVLFLQGVIHLPRGRNGGNYGSIYNRKGF